MLCGVISRLSWQKGLDLLGEALPTLLDAHNIQVIVLGSGEEQYEEMFTSLAKEYPKQLVVALRFDNILAHHIYAGSDAFLMPSRYEPCGLGQMISLAYGTLPIVRATGGLADTVKEIKTARGKGNGFVFEDAKPKALVQAILRALKCFQQKRDCWERGQHNAFTCDFSWSSSAQKYVDVYHEALQRVRGDLVMR